MRDKIAINQYVLDIEGTLGILKSELTNESLDIHILKKCLKRLKREIKNIAVKIKEQEVKSDN